MASSSESKKTGGMFVTPKARDMNVRKSIKVKLPIRQHIKLHALKLFSENNISETVEHALDRYFEELKEQGVEIEGLPTPAKLLGLEDEEAADTADDS